jgi:hypothetical protein
LILYKRLPTLRAHENAARGNKAATRKTGLEFKEYAVGDMFYRKRNQVRTFRSVQEKEAYKINVKLAASLEGPYKVVNKVNAVVYVAEIDGEQKRIHAVNMKPGVRPTRQGEHSQGDLCRSRVRGECNKLPLFEI